MAKFKYEGYDGQAKHLSGVLEAESYSKAYDALKFQGLTIVSLAQERGSLLKFFSESWTRLTLGGRWRSVFFRELAVMLKVMNLHDALQTLAKNTSDAPSKKIFSELAGAIKDGATFGEALRRHEIIFGVEAIQTVEIGETSGKLQEVMGKLADRLERSYSTRRKVSGAMYYPLVVLFVAIVAAIIMARVTLPVFEEFYSEQGGELPLITLLLFGGGKFFAENMFLIFLAALAGIFFAIIIYREVSAVRYFFGKVQWQIKIFREIELRNLFGQLNFLLESGIILNEAIKLCAESSGNLYVKKFLGEVQLSIERGEKLGEIFRRAIKNFPPLYLGLISTGEESGELSEMLGQCETMADFEVDEILRELPAKAEIYGTLLAGILVGALVFAVVLPILNMTNLF